MLTLTLRMYKRVIHVCTHYALMLIHMSTPGKGEEQAPAADERLCEGVGSSPSCKIFQQGWRLQCLSWIGSGLIIRVACALEICPRRSPMCNILFRYPAGSPPLSQQDIAARFIDAPSTMLSFFYRQALRHADPRIPPGAKVGMLIL